MFQMMMLSNHSKPWGAIVTPQTFSCSVLLSLKKKSHVAPRVHSSPYFHLLGSSVAWQFQIGYNLIFRFLHCVSSVEECTPEGISANEHAVNSAKSRLGPVLHSHFVYLSLTYYKHLLRSQDRESRCKHKKAYF